jgi:hypothetical protein
MICTIRELWLELSSEGDEMVRACSTNGGENERVIGGKETTQKTKT